MTLLYVLMLEEPASLRWHHVQHESSLKNFTIPGFRGVHGRGLAHGRGLVVFETAHFLSFYHPTGVVAPIR